MSIKRSIIILDTETTGLDPELGCEVMQISATAINYWDFADHHAGTFNYLVKPLRPEKAQAGAIDKTGDIFERAQKEGIDPTILWKKFASYCLSVNDGKSNYTKPIFMAFNSNFDSKFIKFHMKEYGAATKDSLGLFDYPWSFEFDAMTLGYALFESDFNTDNIKLDTMLGKLGMSRATGKHDAMEDVNLLKDWVKRVMTYHRKAFKMMKLPTNIPNKL